MTQETIETYPDLRSVSSEITLGDTWDSRIISDFIRTKSSHGEMPAFLFLGLKEAALLTEHLALSFGEEAVSTLVGTYYMGLEIVPIVVESFVGTAGRKTVRTLQDPVSRRPAWRDEKVEALWQFRI